MRVQTTLAVASIAILLVVLTWPALNWLWQEWQSNETYSHGPFILLLSIFFAWRQVKRGPPLPVLSTPKQQHTLSPALGIVLCSLGGMLWAMTTNAFYLALLALILLIVGIIWYLSGTAQASKFAFPVGYLAFAVPLPFTEPLSVLLQQWTVSVSTALARFLGIPAACEGSKIMLTTCDLSVGAPCSGLHSLSALAALAAVMAYILQGQWWARWALVVLAVPAAFLANTGRVLALLLVAEQWGSQVALRLWHSWSGLAFFGLACALLIAMGRWLGCQNARADI